MLADKRLEECRGQTVEGSHRKREARVAHHVPPSPMRSVVGREGADNRSGSSVLFLRVDLNATAQRAGTSLSATFGRKRQILANVSRTFWREFPLATALPEVTLRKFYACQ